MNPIATLFLLVFCLSLKAQDFKHVVVDGGIPFTLNGSKHAYGPDSSLVSISTSGTNQIGITKVGTDGVLQWQYKTNSSIVYGHYDVAVIENGDVIFMHTTEAPTGAIRYWIHVVKLDKDGRLLWAKMSESYQDFRPSVMEYLNGKLHISGRVYQADTQIFYMQLDTSAVIQAYDSRKAKHFEQISSLTTFKDWIYLGGHQSMAGYKAPLFVAIDPGGNIRYFYHLPEPQGEEVIDMVADSDSLVAITGKSFITFSRVVERMTRVYTQDLNNGIYFSSLDYKTGGGFVVAGIHVPENRFTQQPALLNFNNTLNVGNARIVDEYDLTHAFTFVKTFSDNTMVLGGNRQLNHYYGVTMTLADQELRSICTAKDTLYPFTNKNVGIFTYVPESTPNRPAFKPTFVNLEAVNMVAVTVCSPKEPVANFELNSDTICIGECLSIVNMSSHDAQRWWTAEGSMSPISSDRNPTLICYNEAGIYELKLKVKNGQQEDSMIKSVVVQGEECEEYLYVPNAFSPNKNHINELFMVVNNLEQPIDMRIYSRYGELIHQSSKLQPSWDGYYQGQVCQAGVYFYILDFIDGTGKSRRRIGTFHLLESN